MAIANMNVSTHMTDPDSSLRIKAHVNILA